MKTLLSLLFPAVLMAGWVSPTGNRNPGAWGTPTNGYDGDTLTSTGRSGVPAQALILYRAPTNCDTIRYKGSADNSKVEVYYTAGWHTIVNGAWSDVFTNYAVSAGDTESVDSVKFTNNGTSSTLYELYLWDTDAATPSGDTTKWGGSGTDTLRIGGMGADTVKVGI